MASADVFVGGIHWVTVGEGWPKYMVFRRPRHVENLYIRVSARRKREDKTSSITISIPEALIIYCLFISIDQYSFHNGLLPHSPAKGSRAQE